MVKTWVSSYLPKQKELENLGLIAVHTGNWKLWPFICDIETVVHDQCFFVDLDFV